MAKAITNVVKSFRKVCIAAAAVVAMGLSATSFGAILVDFKPEPTGDAPEVQFNGGSPKQLTADIGAQGNGIVDVAGGLTIETPFVLNLPAAYNPSVVHNLLAGTTTFKDVTMEITNLFAAGAANVTPIAPGITLVTQPLTSGEFKLWSYKPANDPMVLLLSGTVGNAVISGLLGQNAGGVFSASVTYDYIAPSLIGDAAEAAGWAPNGDLSWSLLDIKPILATAGGTLGNFKANMVGQFSAIPEPASLGVLALVGIGLASRRRTR